MVIILISTMLSLKTAASKSTKTTPLNCKQRNLVQRTSALTSKSKQSNSITSANTFVMNETCKESKSVHFSEPPQDHRGACSMKDSFAINKESGPKSMSLALPTLGNVKTKFKTSPTQVQDFPNKSMQLKKILQIPNLDVDAPNLHVASHQGSENENSLTSVSLEEQFKNGMQVRAQTECQHQVGNMDATVTANTFERHLAVLEPESARYVPNTAKDMVQRLTPPPSLTSTINPTDLEELVSPLAVNHDSTPVGSDFSQGAAVIDIDQNHVTKTHMRVHGEQQQYPYRPYAYFSQVQHQRPPQLYVPHRQLQPNASIGNQQVVFPAPGPHYEHSSYHISTGYGRHHNQYVHGLNQVQNTPFPGYVEAQAYSYQTQNAQLPVYAVTATALPSQYIFTVNETPTMVITSVSHDASCPQYPAKYEARVGKDGITYFTMRPRKNDTKAKGDQNKK